MNELRKIRVEGNIPMKQIVDIVRAVFPKFDKPLLSKCEHSNQYGIELTVEAMNIVREEIAHKAVATGVNNSEKAEPISNTGREKTALYHEILKLIPKGRDHAISRQCLVKLAKLSDREVRKCIEQARHDGHIIINDGSGIGYYLTDNIDDILQAYHKEHKRMLAILHRTRHLRRRLKEAGIDI